MSGHNSYFCSATMIAESWESGHPFQILLQSSSFQDATPPFYFALIRSTDLLWFQHLHGNVIYT